MFGAIYVSQVTSHQSGLSFVEANDVFAVDSEMLMLNSSVSILRELCGCMCVLVYMRV
jgi:hypothetical protein